MQASPDLSRVLILATHPDDDVIGAGGLIQRATSSTRRLRVAEHAIWQAGGQRHAHAR
jgi:LmbE family N-acetylglucosaminyl deacetylase